MVMKRKFNEKLFSTYFMLAQDYLKLNPVARFNIGKDLNIVDENDVIMYDLDKLDEIIFSEVVNEDLVPQFVSLIYKAQT